MQMLQHKPVEPQTMAITPAASSMLVIIATKGSRQVPVPVEEIAYCFLQDDIYYLKTYDEQQLMTNETLDELANLLPASQFFRINRQILANAKACASFRSIANGKLEVMFQPSMPEPATVSQKKAAAFKSWLVNR
jgi:DNA-binding LytR/AlgR family response regulator